MRRTVRKVLSFILSMCMVLSCITVLGTTTKAAETAGADKTITGLGTGAIANPKEGAGGWSYVYYGTLLAINRLK